ncbi:MAG: hypothetical protein ACE5I7_17060 [Candidatus Binatia bacterium]
MRDVVAALNRIPGVVTRASCEGATAAYARHRHADLAYVLFRFPLPLRFEAFLLGHLDAVARVENDGLYSRWPSQNRAFVRCTAAATRTYLDRLAADQRAYVARPLRRLRARLARALVRRQETKVALCWTCRDLVTGPHPALHHACCVLELAPAQEAAWFAQFVKEPANALDPVLTAKESWADLQARARRGDFGSTFHHRWQRYRRRMIADISTRQLRIGVKNARRQDPDLDFFYDGQRVVLRWGRTEK